MRLSDGIYASSAESDSDLLTVSKVTRCIKLLPRTTFSFSSLKDLGVRDVVVKKSSTNKYLMSQQLKVLNSFHPAIDVGLDVDVLQIDPSLAEAVYALGAKYLVLPATATEKELITFGKEVHSIKSSVPAVLQLPSLSSASYGRNHIISVVKELSEKVRRVSERSHNVAACVISVEKEELVDDCTSSLIKDLISKIRNISLK